MGAQVASNADAIGFADVLRERLAPLAGDVVDHFVLKTAPTPTSNSLSGCTEDGEAEASGSTCPPVGVLRTMRTLCLLFMLLFALTSIYGCASTQAKKLETKRGYAFKSATYKVRTAIPDWPAGVEERDNFKNLDSNKVTLVSDPFREKDALTVSGLHLIREDGARGVKARIQPIAELQRDSSEVDGLFLWLLFNAEDWTYLKCNSVAAVAGDRRLSWEAIHDGDVNSGVFETLEMAVKPDELEALTTEDARIQVCNDRYRLTPLARARIMQFVAELEHRMSEKDAHAPDPGTAAH